MQLHTPAIWTPPRGIIKPPKLDAAPTRWRGRKFPQTAVFGGVGGGGGGGGTLAYAPTGTGIAWQNSGTPPLHFTTANIGTASADRRVVVGIVVDGNLSNGTVSNVAIGALNFTKDVGIDPSMGTAFSFQSAYIWSALVTSGSGVQTIDVSCSGFPAGMTISVGIITGSATSAKSASGTAGPANAGDPWTASALVPANGVGVALMSADRTITSPSWNITGDDNNHDAGANTRTLLMAHGTNNNPSLNTGAGTIDGCFVCATYAP